MTQIPVRVELRDGSSDRSCSFTIHEEFLTTPQKGDQIIIPDAYLSVSGRFHFCMPGEAPSFLVITNPYVVSKYDDMLKVLDWFKDQYEIADFKADDEPATYYSFYRSVIRLLEWKTSHKLDTNQNSAMKVFSAASAAVLVAERLLGEENLSTKDYGEAYAASNQEIEALLNVVLDRKRANPEVDLLAVIKEWETVANPDGDIKWTASESQVLDAAKVIFPKLRSIPADMLPDGLS